MQVIAEIGSNWKKKDLEDSYNHAITSVYAAATAGANAAKFQLFRADSLYSKERAYTNWMNAKQYELPLEWLPDLQKMAHRFGIELWASIFSEDLIDPALLYVDGIKVASGDLTNESLVRAMANASGRVQIPLAVSTGAATYDEIENALEWVGEAHLVILFHCVSSYPTDPLTLNLRSGLTFAKNKRVHSLGFSDHTLTSEAACLAVALGYSYFEKHFAAEGSWATPDTVVSASLEKLHQYVTDINKSSYIIGSIHKSVEAGEQSERIWARRGKDGLRPANDVAMAEEVY